MSQIFDALQRSEAERSGNEPAADAGITEMLRRSERQSAAERESESVQVPSTWTRAIVSDSPVVAHLPRKESATSIPVALNNPINSVPVENRTDGLMQCEVMSIDPPVDSHLVVGSDVKDPAGEAFHLLGVRLRHLRRQRQLKKILITSTIPQEGKSMVAANLACTLALRTQQKVLLLEGDVRRPTQSTIFGLRNRPGICEWLNGEASLIKNLYMLEPVGIWILPAGTATGNSLELLQSGRTIPMMEQLINWFDWIVIDSPPILPLADTSVWTNLADGILLVTRQGTTQKGQLKRGLEALGTQKLIGAILNSAKSVEHTDYYYRPADRLPNEDAEA
jgi:capsular exopolysaccharide synthesis family protein